MSRWPAATRVTRSQPRLDLAQFYFAHGLAAEAVGLQSVRLADRLGASARTAPAAAVAWLLWYSLESG